MSDIHQAATKMTSSDANRARTPAVGAGLPAGLAMLLTLASPSFAQTQARGGPTPNANDMDSVDGFFCLTYSDIQDASTGPGSFPECIPNGGQPFPVVGMERADRLALDVGGRLWMARNPTNALPPGLYVQVNDQAVKVADLPPLNSGDFIDSLVLASGPVNQTLPGGAVVPLRTPVVLTAQGRLFVYVMWGTAANYAGSVDGAYLGQTSIPTGWYEEFAPPTSPGFDFLTLSHAYLGSNVRAAMLLGSDGISYALPLVNSLAVDGVPYFGAVRLPIASTPHEEHALHNSVAAYPPTKQFIGPRIAWSPRYVVTHYVNAIWADADLSPLVQGPHILERGRPAQVSGFDSAGEWTFLPCFDSDCRVNTTAGEIWIPYTMTSDLPPPPPRPSESDCAVSNPPPECVCREPEPDRPRDCYPLEDAVFKVVPSDGFDRWGTVENVKLWVMTDFFRVWWISSVEPTSPFLPQLVDPWPDTTLEPSGYRAITDPTRGIVYEKLAAGYAEIPSEPLATPGLALPRSQLAVDVFVPSGASGWIGDVQMTFELAAAGVQEQYVGYASLDNLPKGAWSTVYFNFDSQWRQALLGDFPGARFRTFVNTSIPGVRVGLLRFHGTASSTLRAPHQARLANVRTTPALDFETTPGWTGPKVEGSNLASSGSRAARVTSSGWTEMLSPSFSTNELPAVGTKLSVDVFVPTPSPESHWQGDIQAFLTCENTSVQNAWIDWTGLQNLFSNEFNTVTLDMPQAIRAALQVPNRTCKIRLTVNTAPTSSTASFYVDRVGFRD